MVRGPSPLRRRALWLALVGLFTLVAVTATKTSLDIHRYRAYAQAILGRPYDAFYVRSDAEWRAAFGTDDRRQLDEAHRSTFVTVRPRHPLVPYRDFLIEYPPGFLLATLPPALVATSSRAYDTAFNLWMAAFLAIAIGLCVRISSHVGVSIRAADLWLGSIVALLALGEVTVQRYDALVSVLICTMCWATLVRRPIVLGVSTAAGVLAKVVPVLAAIVCGLYLIRTGRRRECAAAAVTAVGLLAGVLAATTLAGLWPGLFDFVRYEISRPLEFESTAAALVALGHVVDPRAVSTTYSYGSVNIVGPWDGPALWLTAGMGMTAILFVYRRTWQALARGPEERQARILVSAIPVLMALVIGFAKVASVQYLLWLIPLAVLSGFAEATDTSWWLLLATLIVAQLVFPFASGAAIDLHPWANGIVLARQLCLITWAVRVFRTSVANV